MNRGILSQLILACCLTAESFAKFNEIIFENIFDFFVGVVWLFVFLLIRELLEFPDLIPYFSSFVLH